MSDIMDFSPLWGEWHIKEQLGKGSFGSVYKAEKEEYGNTYVSAIKHLSIPSENMNEDSLLADGLISDRKQVKPFYDNLRNQMINEINMCYALRGNTNIVSYEDHCIIPKKDGLGYDIFIRMEYLTPLPKYMREHKFKEEDVIQLGEEICEALNVLEAHHIIHRDIKPANIFVNSMGVYKLGDFGESKVLSGSSVGMTVRGTYAYMSPEISKGSNANITADLYSLGIVLYRLLNSNKAPFMPLDNSTATAQTMENANIRRFKGERIPLPMYHSNRGLTSVVMKACEYEPKDRWQTPKEMKKALEALEDDSSTSLQQIVGEYYHNQPPEMSGNVNQSLYFSQNSFSGNRQYNNQNQPGMTNMPTYPNSVRPPYGPQQQQPMPQQQQQGYAGQRPYGAQGAFPNQQYPNVNNRPVNNMPQAAPNQNYRPAAVSPVKTPAPVNTFPAGNPSAVKGPQTQVKKKSPAPIIITLSIVTAIVIVAVIVIFSVSGNKGSIFNQDYSRASTTSRSTSSSVYASSGSSSSRSSSSKSSSDSASDFVGTWHFYENPTGTDDYSYIEIYKSGSFYCYSYDDDKDKYVLDYSGTWELQDEDTIYATIGSGEYKDKYLELEKDGSKLYLINSENKRSYYAIKTS